MTKADASKPAIDWERIEGQFRAGLLTLREIAAEHGITHGAINKRAKRDGWERDLQAKIKAKADALVSKAAADAVSSGVSKERRDTEKQIVDANAHAVADVAIRHRVDLKELRDSAIGMLTELRQVGEHTDTLDEMARLLSQYKEGDDQALELERMRDMLRRTCGLAGRIGSMKALTETITKIIDAERVAFKLDEPANDGAKRQLGDLEIASKLAYFVELGRKRAAEAKGE